MSAAARPLPHTGSRLTPAAPLPIDLTSPWHDPAKPHARGLSHLDWAETIARLIARSYGRYSPRSWQADDLVAAAHAILAELAPRFDAGRIPEGGDPDGQFRGWAHAHIRGACERAVQSLRNGGTAKTSNDRAVKELRVRELPANLAGARGAARDYDERPRTRRRYDTGTDRNVTEELRGPEESLWLGVCRRLWRVWLRYQDGTLTFRPPRLPHPEPQAVPRAHWLAYLAGRHPGGD
jgi:hypothetical protein